MPNQPRPDNPGHTIRMEADLWAQVQALARNHGMPASEIVRLAVVAYVAKHG